MSSSTATLGTGARVGYGRDEERRRRNLFIAQLAPVLAFYAFALVFPYFTTIANSFYLKDRVTIVGGKFTLENYELILTDSFYLWVTGWSIFIASVVTLVNLVLGYPLAWKIVHSGPKLRNVLLAAVLAPLLINLVVRTYSWQVVLGNSGVLNSWLIDLGFIAEPLQMTRNVFGVVVGMSQITLPFMVLSLTTSIERIDPNLIQAAEGLGSGPIRTFKEVVWPLTLPGVSAGSILVFCYNTSAFVTPAVLGGNRVTTIATQIYQQFMFLVNWPLASALVVLLLVINGAFIWIVGRLGRPPD